MKIISSRSGITILETIIVLILGSLIISSIWLTYSQMNLNNKIFRTVLAANKTAAATREFLASRSTIPTDLSVQMHQRDLMPAELSFNQITGNQANYTSPLGALFRVTSVPGPSQRLFFIWIEFSNRDVDCPRIVPQLIGNIRMIKENGIASYSLGNLIKGEAAPGGTTLRSADVPTPAQVALECSRANALGLYYAVRP